MIKKQYYLLKRVIQHKIPTFIIVCTIIKWKINRYIFMHVSGRVDTWVIVIRISNLVFTGTCGQKPSLVWCLTTYTLMLKFKLIGKRCRVKLKRNARDWVPLKMVEFVFYKMGGWESQLYHCDCRICLLTSFP